MQFSFYKSQLRICKWLLNNKKWNIQMFNKIICLRSYKKTKVKCSVYYLIVVITLIDFPEKNWNVL